MTTYYDCLEDLIGIYAAYGCPLRPTVKLHDMEAALAEAVANPGGFTPSTPEYCNFEERCGTDLLDDLLDVIHQYYFLSEVRTRHLMSFMARYVSFENYIEPPPPMSDEAAEDEWDGEP